MGSQQQGEAPNSGWPLGLPPVTLQMRLVDAFTAVEPNPSVLGTTPSFSSLSSSDFETQSSLSFFPERSITLGSLMGLPEASDPSSAHSLGSRTHPRPRHGGRNGINSRRKLWRFIRCGSCRDYHMDDVSMTSPPSLAQYLEAEKEAEKSQNRAKVYINIMYEEGAAFVPDAMNPLFDSTGSNVSHSSHLDLPMIAEEGPEIGPMRHANSRDSTHNANCKDATTMTKHRRSYSDTSCAVNCVSNIWGSSRASPCKGEVQGEIHSKKSYNSLKLTKSNGWTH